MQAIEECLSLVLFMMLYKVVLTFEFDRVTVFECGRSNEQYFPAVLFTMLYKMVLTLKSMSEILKCDYSNVSF